MEKDTGTPIVTPMVYQDGSLYLTNVSNTLYKIASDSGSSCGVSNTERYLQASP